MELNGVPIPSMDWESPNLPETWRKFFEHCQLIFKGPLKDKEESVHISYLLLWIGDKGREIYGTLALTTAERKKLETIFLRILTHLQPKVNLIFARYKFYNEVQGDQTFEQFLTKLRVLAKPCSFADQNEMIRDRIVFGIHEQKIRERLINEGDKLTLDKAIEICQSHEYAQTQLREMKNAQSEPTTVNFIKARQTTRTRDEYRPRIRDESRPETSSGYQTSARPPSGRQGRRQMPQAPRHDNRGPVSKVCDNCGYYHKKGQCPAKGKQCDNCKKWNHFAKKCRSKTVSVVKESEDFYVDTVHNGLIRDNQAFVDIEVGSHQISFKLDTGSQVNILPESCFNKLKCTGPLQKAPANLTAYNGSALDSIGYRNLPCRYKNKSVDLGFYIVKTNSKPILSLKTCLDLGLIELVYSVDTPLTDDKQTEPHHPLTKAKILETYDSLFEGIGLAPGECDIHVDPNAQPVILPPRRVPVALHTRLKDELDRMERNDIIAKVTAPTRWVNSLVIVEKHNGDLRVCLDPMHLNKAILRPHYPMRTLEDVLPKLSNAKYFTKLDAKSGYWTLKLSEESSLLTTFNSPFGKYRFKRMAFGLKNAQDEFQRLIDECFDGLPGVIAIVDDLLVYGRTRLEHDRNLTKVLQRSMDMGLRLNKDKLEVGVTEVAYFGHTLTADGLKPDPSKVDAIKNMDAPRNRAELETVLGMVNYLSKFAPNLAEVTAPLRSLLTKSVEFAWDEPQATAFQRVKDILTQTPGPVLSYYDVTKPLTLQVDASKHGLGATLLQDERPVAYASKSLTKTEINYSQIEKEMFAILFGCRRFHQYLYGRIVRVETDHLPLVSIMKKPICVAPPRLQRMMLQLQRYELNVNHLPGKKIPVADTLSRKPLSDTYPGYSDGIDVQVHTVLSNLPISDRKFEEIRKCTENDPQMQCLIETILTGWPDRRQQCPNSVIDYWNYRDQLSVSNGLILKGSKVVIPTELRPKMLEILHTGHMGIEKCQMRARDTMFWPRISANIADIVSKCSICQERRSSNTKEPLRPHPIPDYPWQTVATDLFLWDSKDFLVVTDYYSRYFEVIQIPNAKSSTVIHFMKAIFSRHGIPERMVSDNGPCYSSADFAEFMTQWDIHHVTCSPYNPQSNGLAEKSVQTIKKIFTKAKADKKDPYIGLLEYRTTQLNIGYSPSELLMGRKLRSVLPVTKEHLVPKLPDPVSVQKEIRAQKVKGKTYYDRGAKALSSLSVGESVRVQMPNKSWRLATVVKKHSERSYSVRTADDVIYRKNRRQLILARLSENASKPHPVSTAQCSTRDPISCQYSQPPTSDNDSTIRKTRRGRKIKPRQVLNL